MLVRSILIYIFIDRRRCGWLTYMVEQLLVHKIRCLPDHDILRTDQVAKKKNLRDGAASYHWQKNASSEILPCRFVPVIMSK